VEGFIQDDFHVSPTLTLNLGVRWALIPHVYDKYNNLSTFLPTAYNSAQAPQLDPKGNIVPGTGNLLNGIVIAGQGISRGLTNTYYNNWGPRLGFSWDPFGRGTTVLRGGFGVGYYREQGNDTYDVTNNPPFAHSVSLSNPLLDNPAGGTQVLAPANLSVFNPAYKIPMTEQYSLGIQRQLPGATILTVSYVGSHGTHLTRTININQPLPVNGYNFSTDLNLSKPTNLYRPYQGWGSINARTADGSSEYNSLQVNLEKQMTHNLRFQAAYTWSKSMDNASNYGEGAQNPYNRASEWSLSDFDRTHVLQVNYIYDLPFFQGQQGAVGRVLGGWEVSGITTIEGGTPVTVTQGSDPFNSFDWGTNCPAGQCFPGGIGIDPSAVSPRPDVTGNPNGGPQTAAQWFNTKAFTDAIGHFGNSGRYTVQGPGMINWDFSLIKNVKINERISTQIRGEFFNVFNHVNLNNPNGNVDSKYFGTISGDYAPRTVQLGIKVIF